MKAEVISEQQGISIVLLFILGNALIISIGAQAKSDIWLAVLIAIGMAIPVLTLYARLHYLLPGMDLFDILQYGFGSVIGRITGLIYVWFAFHLGSRVLRNFGEFIITVGLEETPQLLPISILAILCLWCVKEGLEVLGRFSNFFTRFVVIMVLGTSLLLLTEVDFSNLSPFLYHGMAPVTTAAFKILTFPFTETVIFTMVFSNFQKKSSPYKIYLIGLILGGLILFITITNEVLVLGSELYETSYFPGYRAVQRINIRNFIQRLEILAGVTFLISGFVQLSICLLATCKGLAKVLNFDDYRFIVTPTTFLMVTMSILIYNSIIEMNRWAVEIWPVYAAPFQLGIPVVLWLACELKMKLKGEYPA